MDLHLYIDTQARQFVKGPQSSSKFAFPSLYQGDTLNLFLHGVTPNTDPGSLDVYEENPISFTGIKCGIGLGADAPPAAGTFKIRLVGQTETTAAMDCDVDQPTLLAALNALASVQAVSALGLRLDQPAPVASNMFLIRWVDPTITALFEIVENYLEPLCFTRSVVQALGYGQIQALKFIAAPYSFTDQFSYPSPTAATTGSVRVGTSAQNCIQSVTVAPDAMGSLTLTFAGNATTLISVADLNGTTDGSSDLAAALNGLYSDGQTRFSVTCYATGVYYVEFLGPLAKTDFPVMAVTMQGQEPLDTPMGTLPMNGADLEIALHGQPKLTLLFELEITNGSDVATIQATSITVINDMIDGAMALAANPPWLTPTDPTSPAYDPAGQTIVAPGAYVSPIGSGVGIGTGGTSFVITHNLGTSNCLVDVRETGGTHHRLPDNSYVTTYLNDNQIQVDFQTAPTDGEYFIIIGAVVPAEMAFPNIQITIAQVTNLQNILNELLAGIDPNAPISAADLPTFIPWYNYDARGNPTTLRFAVIPDALIPATIPRLDDNGQLPPSTMPPGVPVYVAGPPPSIVITLPGTPSQTITLLTLDTSTTPPTWSLPVGILPDPSTWPGLLVAVLAALQSGASLPNTVAIDIPDYTESFPPAFELSNHCPEDTTVTTVPSAILPAIFNAPLSGNVTGGLPPPAQTGCAGNRFTVVGSASSPADIYREAQTFKDSDEIASNGYHWYKTFTSGDTSYPKEYARELFSFYVSGDMVQAGARFAVDFTLQAALSSPDLVRGQYLLTLEIGTPQGATGSGIGANLSGVNWYEQIIQEIIILSSSTVFHHFNYAVLADATTGAYTATKGVYATTGLPATAPTAPGFAVRATLTKFDVENTVPNPSGQISLKMLKATASVVKPTS